MRRSWLGLAVLGLLALAALFPERARLAAQQVSSSAAAADLPAAIGKANLYIELMKATERALESWERYLSWVDLRTGPTGKERYISYGLYELHDARGVLSEARETARAALQPDLDAAVMRYADAYEALAPVMNEAAAYYERQDYRVDKAAEGRALHARMVPLAGRFLKEREALEPALRAFARDVERRETAAIEASEGRSRRWHGARTMAAATRVVDVFPKARPVPIDSKTFDEMLKGVGPTTSGEDFDAIISGVRKPVAPPVDMAAFDEALKAFERAVGDLDAFAKEHPDGLGTFREGARQLLAALRSLREPLARAGGRESDAAAGFFSHVVTAYFSLLSESSSLTGGQVRFFL